MIAHPHLRERIRRLMQVPVIGEVLLLIWVLYICGTQRISSIDKAMIYCGLCSGQNESAGKDKRGPISKKRNKHLRSMLIEIAKLAPLHNEVFAQLYHREKERGSNHSRASLAVARKIAALLLTLDKNACDYDAAKHAANLGLPQEAAGAARP